MEREPQQPNYYDEYEIDLREYIMLLWDHKLFIIGLTVLAMIGAFLASTLILSPKYESEATILAPDFVLLNGTEIYREEYISFLTGDTVITEMLETTNQNISEEKITDQELLNSLSYSLSEETNQVDFSFEFNNPEKTKSILNNWIITFVSRVEEYIKNKNNTYYENVENKVNSDYEEYQSELNKLKTFESENNLNLLNKDLASKENKLIKLNSEIIDVRNQLESTEKELDYVNNRLEKTEQYLVKENLISDEFLQKIQAVNSEKELVNLLNTEEEFLNPEYQNLINREISLSTRITSKRTDLKNYIEDRKILKEEISELQKNISTLSEEKTIIEKSLSNKEKAYQNSNQKLSNIEQSLAEKEYNIELVSSPKLPEKPVSPNTKLNVAIAAVLGLMLAVFIVFFREFMREENN